MVKLWRHCSSATSPHNKLHLQTLASNQNTASDVHLHSPPCNPMQVFKSIHVKMIRIYPSHAKTNMANTSIQSTVNMHGTFFFTSKSLTKN